MAGYGDFLDDLQLIMDSNIRRASSSAIRHPNSDPGTAELQVSKDPSPEEAASPPVEKESSAIPPFVCHTASISLALGSMLSSNLLLSNAKFLPTPANASARPTIKACPRAVSLPSQTKVNVQQPVVPAAKIMVGVNVESVSSPTRSSKKSMKSTTAFPDYQMLSRFDKSYGNPMNGAAIRKASIVWFRNDLRIHDNAALTSAHKESLSVIPVYCFDPKDYGKSSSGFDKTGPYRAKFLLECVGNLRENLRSKGSDLIVRIGNPVEVLSEIAKSVGADGLYAHLEVSAEEMTMEEKVATTLKDQGVETKYFWGSTLYHIDDLPFKLNEMPSSYGGFREKVQGVQVRPTMEAPSQLKALPSQGDVKPGDIPSLQDLGLNPSATVQEGHPKSGVPLVGGEAEALKRLRTFSMEMPLETKNQSKDANSMYGANFSCKISPWLAMGCLSPRRMFEDMKKGSRSSMGMPTISGSKSGNDGPLNWLTFELLWRDFFRFITRKYGSTKLNQVAVGPTTGSLAAAAAAC